MAKITLQSNFFLFSKSDLKVGDTKKSFIIPKDVFGREINAIILLSPSGDALRGIAGSPSYKKKRHLYANEKTPVKQFRIDFYKEKFKYLLDTN